jgi:tetratricopeptide (TPR) repeat protein
MSDTSAHRAKEEGGKAWGSGDYPKALEHFSEAINHGGDKDFLKVIYSNRSAVYLKLNRGEDSLKDADKCIELDSQWTKGYTRKGDALYHLKRYTESYNAYNNGLRMAPGDSGLKEKSELAMRAICNTSTSSSSTSSFFPGSSSSSTAASTSALPATGMVRQVRLSIILLLFVYFIPFIGRKINFIAYRYASVHSFVPLSSISDFSSFPIE